MMSKITPAEARAARLNWEEVGAWAALVAAHWRRCARNPTETECDSMVATAREMIALRCELQ